MARYRINSFRLVPSNSGEPYEVERREPVIVEADSSDKALDIIMAGPIPPRAVSPEGVWPTDYSFGCGQVDESGEYLRDEQGSVIQ